jgi:hypothetical protein
VSRRAQRYQARQTQRYGAQIPRTQARVRRLTIEPVSLGPAFSRLNPRARERYELHEGLASEFEQALGNLRDSAEERDVSRAAARAARARHPGMSVERTREQYAALMEYVLLIELIDDSLTRTQHCNEIAGMLRRNESLLRALGPVALRDPSIPNISELAAIIISQDTAARALGSRARDSIRTGVVPWGQRPWFWESQYWDSNYNRGQQIARDREAAFRATRIPVPQPYIVVGQGDIRRVAATLGCSIVPLN